MTTSALRKTFGRYITSAACIAASLSAGHAVAAPGPGIGNLDCGDNEYFKPFAFLENPTDPKGTNVSVMIRGYFMTVFAPDSGRPPGHIGIYDVSNPKAPNRVRLVSGGDTDVFREAHSLPIAIINGKQYIAFQTTQGMQFWDFTDPLTARKVGQINLPGVTGGDYENVAWQASWQGKYLYVSGGNLGIFVIDAGDPTQPRLLTQVATGTTGGFRVGPLFALGDYLVISNMDQGGSYAVLDIRTPDRPALLSRIGNQPRMYAIVVGANDRIYTAGRDGNFLNHSFSDPTKITLVKNALIGEDQLYAATQDHFVYLGRQNNVVKVDMTDEQNPQVVGQGTLGRDHPDHGQVTPLGNLIFIGNDHGTGSAFFCHQRGRDTIPLEVQSTYPKADSTGVSPSSRISMLFSDFVDMDKVTEENIVVREVGGDPMDGIFSYAFNTLSFGPNEPFATDTTYEVVLKAGGLSDVMGNALTEEVVLRFSTGDEIVIPPDEEVDPPDEEPASGGTSGMGGGSTSSGGAPSGGSTAGMGGSALGGSTFGAGGALGSGGTFASGGSGGALSSVGGATSVGGTASSVGGTGDPSPPDDSSLDGGGCSVPGAPTPFGSGPRALLAIAALAMSRLRMRRR
jgi:Bacterial Ig-like domain/LVIVD repeat